MRVRPALDDARSISVLLVIQKWIGAGDKIPKASHTRFPVPVCDRQTPYRHRFVEEYFWRHYVAVRASFFGNPKSIKLLRLSACGSARGA